ncbi:MAG: DUF899 domain-containing protein [Steroidobacteraceae bacterium]|jgi:predicted dithiol-disulfide oxidoreductase (DUF899 family)
MTRIPKIVSREDWMTARQALLAKEKEFTRLRDELSQARRDLPWEEVTKEYQFEGPIGRESLSDLFAGRSQLIVYHFMFGPDSSAGCPHCSFWADNFNGIVMHLNQRDVTMIAVSRAPYARLEAYQKRLGWTFKWVSSGNTSFNFDYQASFTPEALSGKQALFNYVQQDPGRPDREGVSVFFKDGSGRIYHTYSTYARGIDILNTAYNYLDLVPKSRDENGRGPFWVRRHDEYENAPI